MKRIVAQLYEAQRPDYDAEEHGEVVKAGEHHGGDLQIYLAHKITKLRELQVPSSAEVQSTIFKDCIMFVNGLTDPPVDELRRLIRVHGGECIAYRAVKISHYVCDYFTDAQLKQEHLKVKLNAKNKVHNVTVAWVTDSIRRGKRFDENLYAPRGQEQHGKNLSNSYFKPTSSSSSYQSEARIPDVQGMCDAKSSGAQNSSSSAVVDLTSDNRTQRITASQEQFLAALPADLQEEAMHQLRQQVLPAPVIAITTRATATSSTQAASSDTSDVEYLEAEDEPIADVVSSNRQDSLQSMLDCIHFDEEGNRLSSKCVTVRLREYVKHLLSTAIARQTDQQSISQVQELLSDYATWLVRANMFDQVSVSVITAKMRRSYADADCVLLYVPG